MNIFREDEITEFKRTTGEINQAAISITSMLNKHGMGTVYFGLNNDGVPSKFTIVDSTLRDISRKIYEAIKPQIFPEIKVVLIDDVEVIKVSFEGKDKPYSAFGKYYKRVADEDREMSPGELRNMMIDREYEEKWESTLSKETIDDVSEETLLDFYKNATSCGRLPDLDSDKSVLMEKLGILIDGHLTNAGRVLFSKNKPITLKMAVFATEHKTTFLDISRVEGNIFELIDEAISYIKRNIRWKLEMSGDGIHRLEVPEVPIDAIREAVINSFAHARYDSMVQHEIDIYSDRISIINPGSFANEFTPEDFVNHDMYSFLRNEVISRMLYLCNDVETFGSGLKKIYSLCEKANVKISYINYESDFTLDFYREEKVRASSDVVNNVFNNVVNNVVNDVVITKLESQVLDLIRGNRDISIAEISLICGKNTRTIDRAISSLKEKNLLDRVGKRKKGQWRVL